MGVSGLIGHIINNNIDYLVLMVMGSATMIGGYLGARYTNRFSDTSLKRIIGIVLIVVAITMFLRVFQITTTFRLDYDHSSPPTFTAINCPRGFISVPLIPASSLS